MLVPAADRGALSAYAVELTGLEGWGSVEYCRYKRPEVQHAVGGRTDKQYGDGHNGQILLELEAPVHCRRAAAVIHGLVLPFRK
jgi:hypothetical protein